MPKLYEKVPAGIYRGKRVDALSLTQLGLLRREVLAAISRKQEAAGDAGPVAWGAKAAHQEAEHLARCWHLRMQGLWPAGAPGATVAGAVIATGYEVLQKMFLVVCGNEGEACDTTDTWGV
jgi:hypothetical protein